MVFTRVTGDAEPGKRRKVPPEDRRTTVEENLLKAPLFPISQGEQITSDLIEIYFL